jgi:signal peptidase I
VIEALALVVAATEIFVVKGENMYPTLKINQRVEFDTAAKATQHPRVGDIVLIRPPRGAALSRCGAPREPAGGLCVKPYGGPDKKSLPFVTRVVALGGDRISLRSGKFTRNGRLERRKGCSFTGCTFKGTITVPAGHVYLAGDNRGSSDDSRFWGALPIAQVLGRYVRTLPPG